MDREAACYWELSRVPDTRKVFCFGIGGQVFLHVVSMNTSVYTETLTREKKEDCITKPKQKLNELTCYTVLPGHTSLVVSLWLRNRSFSQRVYSGSLRFWWWCMILTASLEVGMPHARSQIRKLRLGSGPEASPSGLLRDII